MYKDSKAWVPTQSEVDEWLEIAGDDNPLHTQESELFGEPVVPGALLATKFSGLLADMRDDVNAEIIMNGLGPLEFKNPIYVGEGVDLKVIMIEQDTREQHVSLIAETDEEEKAVGEAIIYLADKE